MTDAGSDGGLRDASPTDEPAEMDGSVDHDGDAAASDATLQNTSLCGSSAAATTPGEDCPNVVYCGNGGDCDLTSRYCCLVFGGVGDTCSMEPCDNQLPAVCDGPEDCESGNLCCFQGGGTTCSATCASDKKLCHQDSDCQGGRCVKGREDALLGRLWLYWGFCN